MDPTDLTRMHTIINESKEEKNHVDHYCYDFHDVHFEAGSQGSRTIPYNMNAALNVILAIIAILANTLVFLAIRKSKYLHLPSKLLFCCLVLTDLGIGLVAQPMFVVFLITKTTPDLFEYHCFYMAFGIVVSCLFTGGTVMTMTAISMDRYIAYSIPLKYREIVTTGRVWVALGTIWSSAGLWASLWFWSSKAFLFVAVVACGFCLVVSSLAYVEIFRGLHRRGRCIRQVQDKSTARNTLNIAKYRKSASSMLWIYFLFIVCYVPYICAVYVREFGQQTVLIQCVVDFARTLLYLNSCLNPFVYCASVPEIRAAAMGLIRRVCGNTPQQQN